jgi:Holliday junction DNA helicase RuvA
LAVSSETLRQVPAVGNSVTLQTHLIMRDDALQLCTASRARTSATCS